jgi:hypothetical protein
MRGRTVAVTPQVVQPAVRAQVHQWFFTAEARLDRLAADLVADFARNCVQQLHDAVKVGLDQLVIDCRSTERKPSRVDRWLRREIPTDLEPAKNEILLESTDTYPDTLDRLLRTATDAADGSHAREKAVRQILLEKTAQKRPLVAGKRTWRSGVEGVRDAERPDGQKATFDVSVRAMDLFDAAERWIHDSDHFRAHVKKALADYLDDEDAGPHERDLRMTAFEHAFHDVMSKSLPLAAISPTVNSWLRLQQAGPVLPKRVITPIPFPAGSPSHPARRLVLDQLRLEDPRTVPEALDELFVSGGQTKIEITTFLYESYNVMSFESVMKPISEDYYQSRHDPHSDFWQWRRTRPLPHFLPVHPMVYRQLVRGWFVARALGHLDLPPDVEEILTKPMRIWSPAAPGGTYLTFPEPLRWRAQESAFSGYTGMDILPAVLESLPVAMVDASQTADTPLRPYWRLIELGTVADNRGKITTLPRELQDWLATGTGAKSDEMELERPDSQHSPDERREWLAKLFDEYRSQFAKLNDMPIPDRTPCGGAWEMRADLQQAADGLHAAAELWTPRGGGSTGPRA